MEFDRKLDNFKRKFHKVPPRNIIKNEEQLAGMRESSKINIAVLDYVAENIHAGMTTQDIDDLVYQKTTEMGGIPAPLNYEGFPKSVCTSINEQVCHGIPSKNIQLLDGDIINVDCSTILNGYFSDSSRMFCIGNVAPELKKLEFHETPFVSYVIKKGTGMVMAPGMVFTIEPMINAGLPDIYIDEGNNWTIYTDDDSYSAQWEIMVHVTEDGYEVMSY